MTPDPEDLFSMQARALKPSAIDGIHRLLEQPGVRSLAGAWPDPASFQTREIGAIIARLLAEKGGQALQYGSTRGVLALRQALAEMAGDRDAIRCTAEQLIITSGSAQGLDLACRIFIDPGDVVLVGLPSYFGATATIAAHGGRLVGIALDGDGIRVDVMEETLTALRTQGQRVKAVYVIPNFQNPAGVTLSLERRQRLIELAGRFGFMIFEDDPYGELRFEGEHLAPLLALDEAGRVIHFRSASKIFSPGMRIAWAAGRKEVIDAMERFKQATDISSNTLSQLVLLELVRSGGLQRGIERNREHYRRKRDLMLDLMARHFPREVRWTRPSGGFFTFVTLPPGVNADELLVEALAHRIAFVSGPAFFVDGSGRNSFRLSYSQAGDEDIKAVIPRLGELVRLKI